MARNKPRHALTPTYVKHARVTGVTIATAALLTTTAPFVHAADEPTATESATEATAEATTTAATETTTPLAALTGTPSDKTPDGDKDVLNNSTPGTNTPATVPAEPVPGSNTPTNTQPPACVDPSGKSEPSSSTELVFHKNRKNEGTISIYPTSLKTNMNTFTAVRVTNKEELSQKGVHVDAKIVDNNRIDFTITAEKNVLEIPPITYDVDGYLACKNPAYETPKETFSGSVTPTVTTQPESVETMEEVKLDNPISQGGSLTYKSPLLPPPDYGTTTYTAESDYPGITAEVEKDGLTHINVAANAKIGEAVVTITRNTETPERNYITKLPVRFDVVENAEKSFVLTIDGKNADSSTISVKQGEAHRAKLRLLRKAGVINRINESNIVKDITVTSDEYKGDVSSIAHIDRTAGELVLTPPPSEPTGPIALTVTVTTTTGDVYRGVILMVTKGDLNKLLFPTIVNPGGGDDPTVTQVEPVVFHTVVTDPVTGTDRSIKKSEVSDITATSPRGIQAKADTDGNITVTADPRVAPGNYDIEVTYTFSDGTETTVTKTVHVAPIAENTRYVYQWADTSVKVNTSVTVTPVVHKEIHKENSAPTAGDVIDTSPAVKIEMVGAKDKDGNTIEFPRWVAMGNDGSIVATPPMGAASKTYIVEINITYADGTKEGQTAAITVVGKLSDRYDPTVYGKVYLGETVKNVRVTPTDGTEQIPANVTYTIDDKYNVVTGDPATQTLTFTPKENVPEGEHTATLTVTYADGSTDKVLLTYVIGSSFTSEKYDPVTYVTNAPRGKKSTIAPPVNRNTSVKLPEGVTYEPGANVPAWAKIAGNGSVTLTPPRDAAPGHYIFTGIATYSDKSTDDVVYEVVVPTKLPVDIYPVTRRNGVGVKLGKKLDKKMGTQKAGTVEVGKPSLKGLVDLGNVTPKNSKTGNSKSGNNPTGKSNGKKVARKVIRKVPKKTTVTQAKGKKGKTTTGKKGSSKPAANKKLATTGVDYSPYIGLGVVGLSTALASVCALATRRKQQF